MSNLTSHSNGPIIVAGMHRSGTSLTAAVLQQAGLFIGHKLESGNASNPIGHFEDIEILTLHQEILASQGIATQGWTTQASIEVPQEFLPQINQLIQARAALDQVWGWKEPRTTLFLEFWERLLPDAKFIFPYRKPWEVIDSLFRRGDPAFQANPRFALEIWATYNRKILDFYQQHPDKCLLFNMDVLINDEKVLLEKVVEKFRTSLTPPETTLFRKDFLHTEVDHTHRPELLNYAFPAVLDIFNQLEEMSDIAQQASIRTSEKESTRDSFQDWVLQDWRTSTRTSAALAYVEAQLQETRVELQAARAEIYRLEQVIAAMESSKFWAMRNQWFKLKEPFSKLLPSHTATNIQHENDL